MWPCLRGERIEWLANGADLVNWLLQAGVIDAKIAKRFRSENTRALDDVAAEARVLREWLRNFAKQHAGKPLRQNILKELEPLNQLLARDRIYFQIGASDENAPTRLRRQSRMHCLPRYPRRQPAPLL